MISIAMKSSDKYNVNIVINDECFNFISLISYLKYLFDNYNKYLTDKTFSGEVLETKMLINGYCVYKNDWHYVFKMSPKTKDYLYTCYDYVYFCETGKDSEVTINVDVEEVLTSMTKSDFWVVIDMDKKIISHNFCLTWKKDDYIIDYKKTWWMEPSFNILNAKMNDFPICDIEEISKFVVKNFNSYFLDENKDIVYHFKK